MNEGQLNLARKWRAQKFDQIVGQDIAIKMIKNSLYRGQLFPVYLFWGQHGTGKTSMARVFAAAINCQALSSFKQDPKTTTVPCLTCPSCVAMLAGRHPDFIEIDAASNTGVDHVRQIIEAASLLPLMGHKKIYLIDEAHMLSKAAFNAFLKILEEPPASALFMLATTDPQKIIETVRSRCFQLNLKAIDAPRLIDHLRYLCAQEAIYADDDALGLIAQETKGSVRDAINLLEQVRFAQGRVSRDAILNVLGYVDDDRLLELLQFVCRDQSPALMQFLSATRLEQYSADYIWRRLLELVRMTIWASYGVSLPVSIEQSGKLTRLAKECLKDRLTIVLDLFCSHERLFLKTTNKHLLLEMLLLKICRRNDSSNGPTMGSLPQQVAATVIPETDLDEYEDHEGDEDEDDEIIDDGKAQVHDQEVKTMKPIAAKIESSKSVINDERWQKFLSHVNELNDPLLNSIFMHACSIGVDQSQQRIDVYFGKQFVFFSEWLESTKNLWQPLLSEAHGCLIAFVPHFTVDQVITPVVNESTPVTVPQAAHAAAPKYQPRQSGSPSSFGQYKKFNNNRQSNNSVRKAIVDVSDTNNWPMANLLLRYFPGIIREG